MTPETPSEHRDKYRALLLDALRAMREHRGTESTYDEFIARSAALEEWMAEVFGEDGATHLSQDQEEDISSTVRKSSQPMSINRLLDMASDRLERLYDIDVLRVVTDKVLLPTDGTPTPRGDETSDVSKTRFVPRLRKLIALLHQHSIFTDDLVLIESAVRGNMRRKAPYVLMEIPRLQRQVLVCDVVGEATFVTNELLSRDTFSNHTKEELLEGFPHVQKIIDRGDAQWENDLRSALFDDRLDGASTKRSSADTTKVNVLDREKARNEMLSRYTPEQWIAMMVGEVRQIKVAEKGITAIARLFGIEGEKIQTREMVLKLGVAIYGTDSVVNGALKDFRTTADGLREELRRMYTAEQWVALNAKERRDVRIRGRKIGAIGTLFGIPIQGAPMMTFLELGAAIYGEGDPAIVRAIEAENITKDQLKTELLRLYTPETWVAHQHRDKVRIEALGKKIVAINTIFGRPGSEPFRDQIDFLELGGKIFGESNAVIDEALTKERERQKLLQTLGSDPDKWRDAIRATMTAADWVAIKAELRSEISIVGAGLRRIATIFGYPPTVSLDTGTAYYALGRKIFGEDTLCLQSVVRKSPERTQPDRALLETLGTNPALWRTQIHTQVTAAQWISLTNNQQKSLKVAGRGLYFIASRVFAIPGDPVSDPLVYLSLGNAIFPDDPTVIAALERHEREAAEMKAMGENPLLWRQKVRESITVEKWVVMKCRDREDCKLLGLGLVALSGKCGIDVDDPKVNRHDFLKMGAMIYGPENKVIEDALRQEADRNARKNRHVDELARLGRDISLWRQEVRANYSREDWISMGFEKRRAFKLHGKGLKFFATLFGIEGNPLENTSTHLRLGEAIFAE